MRLGKLANIMFSRIGAVEKCDFSVSTLRARWRFKDFAVEAYFAPVISFRRFSNSREIKENIDSSDDVRSPRAEHKWLMKTVEIYQNENSNATTLPTFRDNNSAAERLGNYWKPWAVERDGQIAVKKFLFRCPGDSHKFFLRAFVIAGDGPWTL